MELSMVWPSAAISLESLRPLSPDHFEDDQIAPDVEKLSRSELAGKLLDHFDGIQEEESDPFGWYTHEKSVDIPIFDSLPSPPYNIDFKAPATDNVYLDPITINAGNYEREPVPQQPLYQSSSLLAPDAYDPLPSFYSSLSAAQSFEPAPAVVPLAQPSPPMADPVGQVASYAFGQVKDECEAASTSAAAAAPLNSNSDWLKREALTPPESPKEREIMKILEEIESAERESLMQQNAGQFDPLDSSSFASQATLRTSPVAYTDEDDDDDDSCSRASSASGAFDDPEWTPSPPQSGRVGGRRSSTSKYAATPTKSASSAAAKRRSTKPYSKPVVEERRERKKEQNKNAATRYRLKKKAEVEEAKQEEHLLEQNNKKLRKEVDELCREIRYLKSLMRDVYRRKGVFK